MAETLTQQQVAEIVGVTSRRVRQFDGEKDPPERDAAGNYPAIQFGKWLQDRIRKALGISSDGAVYDYEGERARLTKAQAEKTELEVNELRGDLVRGSVVEQHWIGMVVAMRTRLVALPSEIAPQVTKADDVQRVTDLIKGIIYEALAEIGGDPFPDEVRTRLDRAGLADGNAPRQAADHDDDDRVGKYKAAAKRGGQRKAGSVPKRKDPVSLRNPRRTK